MIEAKTICDSIGRHSPRLVTMLTRYPKFVHQETLRHRTIYVEDQLRGDFDFSFSVSSSRAIPFARMLEEVRSDKLRAAPVKWGAAQRGMSPGDELSDEPWEKVIEGVHCSRLSSRDRAKLIWADAARNAASYAWCLDQLGVHKSIVNRLIEPFIHVNALMTATEPGWLNFFGLRLDDAADPTLRALAEACWCEWCESKPTLLEPGQWHLPFVDASDWETLNVGKPIPESGPGFVFDHPVIKISVARCAHLSYVDFETGAPMTIEKCLALYDKLVGSTPIHASPAEHQATPDDELLRATSKIYKDEGKIIGWQHIKQAGNLGPGWRQYRKMLPGEAIAPLPTAYQQ